MTDVSKETAINKKEVEVKNFKTENGFRTEITDPNTNTTLSQEIIEDKGVLVPQKPVEVTKPQAGGKVVPVVDHS
jgi:hypothetical protein